MVANWADAHLEMTNGLSGSLGINSADLVAVNACRKSRRVSKPFDTLKNMARVVFSLFAQMRAVDSAIVAASDLQFAAFSSSTNFTDKVLTLCA